MTRCWTWQGHCSDQIFLHFSSEPKNWILTTFQNAYKEKPMPWCKTQQATRAPQLFVLFVIWSRSWILIIWPEYCGKFSGMSIFVKKNQFTQFPTHTFLSFVFYPYFSGMPTNPLEKQFALLGTASTAGLLDVQKAYRWLCHIVAYVTVVIAFFLLQAWINDYCLVSGRRFSHWPCLPPGLASWKKSVKLLLRWAGSPNQLHCQGYCISKFSSFNRRYTSSNFRDGKNRASEISLIFVNHIPVF